MAETAFDLVVIGGGPELENLRKVCPPNVEMLGFQEDEVVQQHLRSARARLHMKHETPFFTGGMKTPAELVASLP